jgi:Tfp pilus assembly protein PilN
MIKINLLESVTDKPIATSSVVEKKVSSPVTRLILMSLAVGALTVLFAAWDVVGSHWQQSAVATELEEQKQKAASLDGIMKEQTELENKIKSIDTRIEAIKNLRSTQAGPSAVLDSIRERISSVSGLYLESIEQKGEVLTIKGNSPDESVVTTFGRSLEFSSGLFTNLNIETQRKEVYAAQTSPEGALLTPAVETVNFTIRCTYNPTKAPQKGENLQANNANQPNGNNQQTASNTPPSSSQIKPQSSPAKSGEVKSN